MSRDNYSKIAQQENKEDENTQINKDDVTNTLSAISGSVQLKRTKKVLPLSS